MPSHTQASLTGGEILGLLVRLPLILFYGFLLFLRHLVLRHEFTQRGFKRAGFYAFGKTLTSSLTPRQLQSIMPPSGIFLGDYCRSIQLMSSIHSLAVPGPEKFPMAGLHSIAVTNPMSDAEVKSHATKPVLFYIHGGGYMFALSQGHLDLAIHAAKSIPGCGRLLILEYSLAPAAIYPTQLAQAIAALKFAISPEPSGLGLSPSQLVLGGDSAGGNILLGLLAHLHTPCPGISSPQLDLRGIFAGQKLRGAFVISPGVTSDTSSPSWKENAWVDIISVENMNLFVSLLHPVNREVWVQHLAGDAHFWSQCLQDYVSKMLITVGGRESFRDDILKLAKLMDATETKGSKVELFVAKTDIHAQPTLDAPLGILDGETTKGLTRWLGDL